MRTCVGVVHRGARCWQLRHALADTRCPVPQGGSAKLSPPCVDASERIAYPPSHGRRAGTLRKHVEVGVVRHWVRHAYGERAHHRGVGGRQRPYGGARRQHHRQRRRVRHSRSCTPVAALLFALRVESDAPIIDKLLRETANGAAGSKCARARANGRALRERCRRGSLSIRGGSRRSPRSLGLARCSASWPSRQPPRLGSSGSPCPLAERHHREHRWAWGSPKPRFLRTPTGAASGYKHYLKGELPSCEARCGNAPVLRLTPLIATPGLSLQFFYFDRHELSLPRACRDHGTNRRRGGWRGDFGADVRHIAGPPRCSGAGSLSVLRDQVGAPLALRCMASR